MVNEEVGKGWSMKARGEDANNDILAIKTVHYVFVTCGHFLESMYGRN